MPIRQACVAAALLCLPWCPVWGEQGGDYAGAPVCGECHRQAYAAWRGSHHQLAMAEAHEQMVLGDFGGVSVTFGGVTSTFSRSPDGGYQVHTDGPDGRLQDYRISHTFGWYPLQQYLVPFPGGRLQALGIAWDSRPAGQGGQRWLHLYPEAPPAAGDPLHWTGREQNWNYQCADCHATDLSRGYDAGADRYDTRWAELGVGCEACHGPAAAHAAWAKAGAKGDDDRLTVRFDERAGISWPTDPGTGLPRRSAPRQGAKEIESCAPCHARRSTIAASSWPGQPLLDSHLPALLRQGLYHADGQMLDEVYVYGSFLQSRMYRAGVTCSDCHDPHSGEPRAPADQVCATCHEASRFATSEHHRHPVGSAGADCRACHMPAVTYMVVDPRRDHSFRIPRPDLSLRLGVPNACADCHRGLSAEALDQQFRARFGAELSRRPSFAAALHAGREASLEAPALLAALVSDRRHPAIARATALELLSGYPGPRLAAALGPVANDPEPLMRGALAAALGALPLPARLERGLPLLEDPVLGVRIQATGALAPLLTEALPEELRPRLEGAVAEYVEAQRVNAERPEARNNLGGLYRDIGKTEAAEAEYRAALRLDPRFVPAYVGLADLHRAGGREQESRQALEQGLRQVPSSPVLHHALGLALVRAGERRAAMEPLRLAAEAAPEQTRFAYVYAVALYDSGDREQALALLQAAQQRRPADAEVLQALVSYLRDAGRPQEALRYARMLTELYPGDPGLSRLIQSLGGG